MAVHMPSTSTTVHKNKTRPVRVTATGANGQPTSANLAHSSSAPTIASVTVDASDNRRFKILGQNEGTATITIGSGDNALSISVLVEAPLVDPAQVNRVDLVAFDPEE